MSKRVIVFKQVLNVYHQFIIDENVSDAKIDGLIDNLEKMQPDHIDDVSCIIAEELGDNLLQVNEESNIESEEIEYYDDYIDDEE